MLTRARTRIRNARTDMAARATSDSGFSLVEVVVAVLMIATMMAVLAQALTTTSGVQVRLDRGRAANNLLQGEVERAMSMAWDDVMLAPVRVNGQSGPPQMCKMNGKNYRVSAQSIEPTNTYLVDGIPIVVTRDLQWATDKSKVRCNNPVNDRSDLKVLTVTVQWYSGDPDNDQIKPCPTGQEDVGDMCRTVTIYLSRGRTPPPAIIQVPSPPGGPLDVTAAFNGATDGTVSNPLGSSYVEITWDQPNVTGNAAMAGYTITVFDSSGVQVGTTETVDQDTFSFVWDPANGPLVPGQTYTFKVRAQNLAGSSTYSASNTVSIPAGIQGGG